MKPKNDFSDPFVAGQMVGMLVMLVFIERNKNIPDGALQQLKRVTADNLQEYFNKPSEDIYLMVDNLIKEIQI